MAITQKGDFKNLERFFRNAKKSRVLDILNRYGSIGVSALASATPKDTGLAASSWDFYVKKTGDGYAIKWINTDKDSNGTPIVILIQYGHGTGTGGYVTGRDFINPAMRPIFDKMAAEIGKEVSRL